MIIGHGSQTFSVLSEIDHHERMVAAGRPYRTSCPCCDEKEFFARHDMRRRKLRILIDFAAAAGRAVKVVTITLVRWRCGRCRGLFSDYPDFRTSL
jgi:hypothetical protein